MHGHPISVRGSVRYLRTDSNRELLHKAILRHGKVRLNVSMQIENYFTHGYSGWHGWSAKVVVTSVKQAEQFNLEVESAIIAIGERLGAAVKIGRETQRGIAKHRTDKGRH